MKLLMVLAFVLLGSCATSDKTKGPDGSDHILISCLYTEVCYEEASLTCGKYKIVNSTSETTEVLGRQ